MRTHGGATRARVLLLAVLCAAATRTVSAQDSFGGPPVAKKTPPAADAKSASPKLDKLTQMEREDYGVPVTRTLHAGEMHGPTPASIPGGQVITTQGLLDLQQKNVPHVIVDVLGAPEKLPNAVAGVWLSQPGSFTDNVQPRAAQFLQQATQGQKEMPLVFYCRSPLCWMSYNAALRAIHAGYTNVLWYRGGIESWKMAGQRPSTEN